MNKLYREEDIRAIATSIRAKSGTTDTMKVSEMAAAIEAIPTGGGEEYITTIVGDTSSATNGTLDCSFLGNGLFRGELFEEPTVSQYSVDEFWLLKIGQLISYIRKNKTGTAYGTSNNNAPTVNGSGTYSIKTNSYKIYKVCDVMWK